MTSLAAPPSSPTTSHRPTGARPPAAAPAPADFNALPLRRRATWIVLLGSLTALGAFTVDLYLPAFPTLARQFDVSASAVQLTLTGTLLGVSVGQLLVGPLSDALGRRRPLLAGLALHLVASMLCALAPSILVLGVLRVLQGIGVAAASVVALAIVRDRFAGSGAARLMARLMLVIGASPILAPTLGSALLGTVKWRGIFVVLGLIALGLGVVAAAVLPETLPPARRRSASPRGVAASYAGVVRDRVVVGLLAVAGLSMAAIFGYVAASSFVFQEQYHLSHSMFGLVFAIGGGSLITGSQVNGSLVHRLGSVRLLTTGLSAGTASAVALLVVALTGAGGLVGVMVPLAVTLFFIGLAMPTPSVMAMERHPLAAGTTAALVGALQNGMAAVVSPAASALGLPPAVGMATVVAATLAGAAAIYLLVVAPALRREAAASTLTTAPVGEGGAL